MLIGEPSRVGARRPCPIWCGGGWAGVGAKTEKAAALPSRSRRLRVAASSVVLLRRPQSGRSSCGATRVGFLLPAPGEVDQPPCRLEARTARRPDRSAYQWRRYGSEEGITRTEFPPQFSLERALSVAVFNRSMAEASRGPATTLSATLLWVENTHCISSSSSSRRSMSQMLQQEIGQR